MMTMKKCKEKNMEKVVVMMMVMVCDESLPRHLVVVLVAQGLPRH